MRNMTVSEMKEYLLRVINLEKTVVEQERIIEKSNLKNKIMVLNEKYYSARDNRLQWENAAPEEMRKIPLPELCEEKRASLFGNGIFTISWIFYIVGVLFYFATRSLTYVRTFTLISALAFIGVGACIDIKHLVKWIRWPAAAREMNKQRMQRYEQEKAKQEEEYKEKQQRIERRRKEQLPQIDEKLSRLDQEIQQAESSLSELESSLESTRDTLGRLYRDVPVIHPKYQNFAAVCQIYEYLDTGRCTELTGANGAYNLYESELRQNLIIISLVVVIKKLEQIQDNQYMLYKQMQSINDTLSDMSADIRSISAATKAIQANTALGAYFGAVAAQNTEILKYIALVK